MDAPLSDAAVAAWTSVTNEVGVPTLATLLLSLAALVYLLRAPYRGVGPAFYDSPRRFVITGCASGMGRHMAGVLLRNGHNVCVTDVSEAGLRAAEAEWRDQGLGGGDEGSRVMVRVMDVRNRGAWDAVLADVVDAWGSVDVCLNVAGVLAPAYAHAATDAATDLTLDVNVKGMVIGTQKCARIMMEHGTQGHIINWASMAAIAPVSGVTLYQCSKYAIRGFSLAARKDLAPHGIAVTCFCPDAVQTPMVELQVHYEEGAMAFSGDILTLQDVEDCILNDALPNRPSEVWLSSRAAVARFGDIFHDSRAVEFAERIMKWKGRRRQAEMQRELHDREAGAASRSDRGSTNVADDPVESRVDDTPEPPSSQARRRRTVNGRGRRGASPGPATTAQSESAARPPQRSYGTATAAAATASPAKSASGYGSTHSILGIVLKVLLVAWIAAAVGRRVLWPMPTAQDVAAQYGDRVRGGFFIVTGASSGVGRETALALALNGATVVMASRGEAAGQAAADAITAEVEALGGEGPGTAVFVKLDLTSTASVAAFVDRIRQEYLSRGVHLTGLIANAGAMSPTYHESEAGVPVVWAANHLGHFDLIQQLLLSGSDTGGHARDSALVNDTRVVIVSSYHGWLWFSSGDATPFGEANYTAYGVVPVGFLGAYGNSKRANIVYARELARRTHGDLPISVAAVHPGMIHTALGVRRDGASLEQWAARLGAAAFWNLIVPVTKTPQQGAATQVWAAVAPRRELVPAASDDASGVIAQLDAVGGGREMGGLFYDDLSLSPRQLELESGSAAAATAEGEALWDLSEQHLAVMRGERTQWWTSPGFGDATGGDNGSKDSSTRGWGPHTFSVRALVQAVALHCALYWILFESVHWVFRGPRVEVRDDGHVYHKLTGWRKFNDSPTRAPLLRREKRRTMSSAAVDACYMLAVEAYGRVGEGEVDVAAWLGVDAASVTGGVPASLLWFVPKVATGLTIFVCMDLHFFLTHRLLHVEWLYKNVHYAHHESKNPSVWSSLSFHWFEAVVYFSVYALALVLPMSRGMWLTWKVANVVGPLQSHIGFGRVDVHQNVHHFLHHKHVVCNIGGHPSGVYDKMFGLERGWADSEEATALTPVADAGK